MRDERVAIGVGATGMIVEVLRAVTTPGDKILIAVPRYEGYPIAAKITRLVPTTMALDERGHHDWVEMADAAAGARVVVVCRPHNPTGTIEPAADIERFLRRVPVDTVVLLDEAYVEFLSPQYRIDTTAIVEQFPNVVVVHTVSKAYGLAGIRIGYAVCALDLARKLWSQQVPFGISTTSFVAVAASYDAESQLQQRVRKIKADQRHLQKQLRAVGIRTADSRANFVYLSTRGLPWREVFESPGLQIRHYPGGAVRIAVGARSSSQAVSAIMRGGNAR